MTIACVIFMERALWPLNSNPSDKSIDITPKKRSWWGPNPESIGRHIKGHINRPIDSSIHIIEVAVQSTNVRMHCLQSVMPSTNVMMLEQSPTPNYRASWQSRFPNSSLRGNGAALLSHYPVFPFLLPLQQSYTMDCG